MRTVRVARLSELRATGPTCKVSTKRARLDALHSRLSSWNSMSRAHTHVLPISTKSGNCCECEQWNQWNLLTHLISSYSTQLLSRVRASTSQVSFSPSCDRCIDLKKRKSGFEGGCLMFTVKWFRGHESRPIHDLSTDSRDLTVRQRAR